VAPFVVDWDVGVEADSSVDPDVVVDVIEVAVIALGSVAGFVDVCGIHASKI
jgi:hypothetical protein